MRTMTLTLHPAIDRILEVEHLEPGGTFNARLMQSVPAGKGVNTARSLSALLPSTGIVAAAWIGQSEAAWFEKWLRENNGIEALLFPREKCATRQAYTFMEESGRETHLKESMPPPSRNECAALVKLWASSVRKGDLVALCGSAPPETPTGTILSLISDGRKRAGRVVADTNGTALFVAANSGLYGIKGNAAEFGELLKLDGPFEWQNEYHRKLLAAHRPPVGPQIRVITFGARGAAYITQDAYYVATSPKLPPGQIQSATGCGDAATAGWLWAIQENCPPDETLRRIVACGAAKLASADPGRLDLRLVNKLKKRAKVIRIHAGHSNNG